MTIEKRHISQIGWEERAQIVEEYLAGNQTKKAIWKKYTGRTKEHGEILQWMRKLGYAPAEPEKQPNVAFPTSTFDNKSATPIRHSIQISREERAQIVEEYLAGNQTKKAIWRKYTGRTEEHGTILQWMRRLGYTEKKKPMKQQKALNSLQHSTTIVTPISNTHPTSKQDAQALQAKVKMLEKQLKTAKLQAEGYHLMIELAEQQFKIPIRKKSATK